MSTMGSWRNSRPQLEIMLVRGNHDLHAGDPPTEWGIHCVDEPWIENGLALSHAPCDYDSAPIICGHIHPCVRLHDVDGSTHRVPCFLVRKKQMLLPAFGSFTGTHPVRPRAGERVFVIGPNQVNEISAKAMISA
jgi:metallophosphoesterase superfamily enzyme